MTVKRSFGVRAAVGGGSVLGLLAAGGVALAAGSGAPAIKLTALPVPNGSFGQAYAEALSPNGKTLYVASTSGVNAVNLADPTATPVAITDGGQTLGFVIGLALAPNGKTLYISREETGGSPASDVAIADVGRAASDTQNNTVVAAISDPKGRLKIPTGLAVSPNGKTLFIASASKISASGAAVKTTATIDVARLKNPTSGTIVKSEREKGLSYGISLSWNPGHTLLYASNFVKSAQVLSVSGTTVKPVGVLSGTADAFNLAATPGGHTLYGAIVHTKGNSGGAVTSSSIDTYALSDHGRVTKLLRRTAVAKRSDATAIVVTRTGRRGYVAVTREGSESTPSEGGVSTFTIGSGRR